MLYYQSGKYHRIEAAEKVMSYHIARQTSNISFNVIDAIGGNIDAE